MQKLFNAVLVAVMALAGAVLAQTFTLQQTFTNPNPAPDQFGGADAFGSAVAAVGGRVLVGAPSEDTGALNAGAVYLFDGSSTTPVLTIFNPSPADNERFGFAVAPLGNDLLVCAPGANGGVGAVYLFDGDTGDSLQTYANPNTGSNGDSFGWAVAAVGSNVLVGAPTFNGTGAAYLFNGATGERIRTFQKTIPGAGDQLGWSVAAFGNDILAGAPGANPGGEAYLFNGTDGTVSHTFVNPNTTSPAGDQFGSSIAAAGNYIIIGAPFDDAGGPLAGAAHIFDGAFGVQTISNPSPSSFDQFGRSVAAFGSNVLALIGTPGDNTGAGSATLYDVTNTTPPLQIFSKTTPVSGDQFGNAVAGDGTNISIAAPGDDTAGEDAGAVYFYSSGQANQPPIADAGPDQTVECASPSGTPVTLDGSGSTDPDNDPLTYTWRENGGIIAGPTTDPMSPVTLALGSHTIELTVDDGNGGTDTDEVLVTVEDTTPPAITVQAPISLWPANHKYVTISVAQSVASVSDACAGSIPVSQVTIVSVSSDEPDDGSDIIIASDCKSVDLISDRIGGGNGRVYTINLTVTDPSGNAATASHQVWVPPKNNDPAVDDGVNHTVTCSGGAAAALAANNGNQEIVSLERKATAAAYRPERYALLQNHPNPFNPETEIRFELPEASHVVVKIYSMLGENIRTLADGEFAAGAHTVRWNAQNDRGEKAPSGLYFYQLVTPGFTQTRRMILAK